MVYLAAALNADVVLPPAWISLQAARSSGHPLAHRLHLRMKDAHQNCKAARSVLREAVKLIRAEAPSHVPPTPGRLAILPPFQLRFRLRLMLTKLNILRVNLTQRTLLPIPSSSSQCDSASSQRVSSPTPRRPRPRLHSPAPLASCAALSASPARPYTPSISVSGSSSS